MARKKLVHIHSNVLNKMPKPADLNVGELAVNNNVDNEFISLKNTDEEVVRFSSDKQLVSWMNEKEVFPVSGDVSTDIASNTSQIIIRNNQYADSATTGADVVNHSGAVIDTSAFALSGGNVTFNSVTVNDISAVTINGKDANSLGDITNITYTPNDEIEDGVSGNTLEFAQSGNNNTVSVNLVFDDELNNTSVNAVQNKVLNDVLEEMEEVTAAALNDLNDRVLELENTPDIHVTGGRVSDGKLYIEQENGETIEIDGVAGGGDADGVVNSGSVNTDTGVITLTRTIGGPIEVSGLSEYVSNHSGGNAPTSGMVEKGTGADSGKTYINFYKDSTKLFSIDADALMIDGMVESVSIADNNLVVTWNTDAGKEVTRIPLRDIFNPDNYYTKDEINHSLGEWFSPITNVSSSVTDVVSGMQSTITNIDNRVNTISGDTISGGSVAGTTLVLNKVNGESISIPGLPTPGSVQKDGVVSGGSINQTNGNILLNRTEGLPDVTITGLADFVGRNDKHVTGGSINNQGIIVVEQNGVSPNVELGGLSTYVDSKLNGKYLPLSGGTVSGNTTFTSDLVASGSNGITATKFVKDGGTNTQVLMADGSVKELETITGDNNDYVVSGTVESNGDITLNMHSGGTAPVTGLSQYVSSMLDGNDYVVSGSVNTGTGVIALTNTDPTKNGEIVGLSDYVSSVTQNFITSDQDKYVESGSVNTNDGTISLKIKNQSNPVTIEGLADYVSTHQDGNDNDYVTGGAVNQSSGDIDLTYNTSKTGKITGLAQYVADHSSVGDWVDVSGDTMTGPLVIDPSGNGVTYALEVDGDVSVSGDVTATGAMYSSDKRLKENIELVSAEDIENVKNIGFKSFNFISNKESKRVGVIAQELKDNGLGKFTATNDAGFLTVDYISLLCLKIAELEKEIKELKNNKA